MGSSRKTGSKILGVITPARAEAFLLRLANRNLEVQQSPAWEEASASVTEKLMAAYPEVVEPLGLRHFAMVLPWLQVYLRKAWTAPDERHRGWYLHEMRRHYRDSTVAAVFASGKEKPKIAHDLFSAIPHAGISRDLVDDRLIDPPTVTPFEAAAFYFQSRVADRAKRCAHVDCREPYFIAEKRWQKFCSEECAGPANREAKRRWWHEHKGKESL